MMWCIMFSLLQTKQANEENLNRLGCKQCVLDDEMQSLGMQNRIVVELLVEMECLLF